MKSGLFTAMEIYVQADGKLVCSPYGSGKGFDLIYEGVTPLTTDKWQHISCSLRDKYFAKGQYLSVNLGDSDFQNAILKPKTFAIGVTDSPIKFPNLLNDDEWSVSIGNDLETNRLFEGRVKDVRLWKTVRSDEELYAFRFRQVEANDELSFNVKFMDGSYLIINEAIIENLGDLTKATEPRGYTL